MILCVVGTGTDVGKTHVSRTLLHAASETHASLGLKPIETGVPRGSREGADAKALREAARAAFVETGALTFVDPISPHLAARDTGASIDVDAIVVTLERAIAASTASFVLVESAGGLFSPLGDTTTNLDLASRMVARFAAKVVLVAPNRIGVLHDVSATVRAARAASLALPFVALSSTSAIDPSQSSNAAELSRLGIARDVVTFPRSEFDSRESAQAALACLTALGWGPRR